MSTLPLHPLVVHIPLALAILMPLAAIGVLLATWRRWLPDTAWWLVVVLQAILVAGGFAALQTGEADEEVVEPIVAEALLEAHEDAAKLFEIGAVAVLVVSLVPLFVRRSSARRASAIVAAAGSLGVAALAIDVGHQGGRLVYEQGAANAHLPAAPSLARDEHHHDD